MKKKLIYICFVCPDHLGVRKKIEKQIATWRLSSVEICVEFDRCDGGVFRKYLNRYLVLIKYFIFNYNPRSVVYIRQTVSLPFFKYITRKREYCYEVNADLLQESSTYPSLSRFYIKFSSDSLLLNAKKLFFVSNELAKRLNSEALSFVYPNALANAPCGIAFPRGNNIVFVGNEHQAWQGVDILFELIEMLPEYHFHLIGDISGAAIHNVTFHGVLAGDSYDNLMRTMDYAVGTLAFYRSGLTEGSPLKVRDYIKYNLPTIVGYEDSDFFEAEFMYQLDTRCIPGSVADIKVFLSGWKNKSIHSHINQDWLFRVRETKRIVDIF